MILSPRAGYVGTKMTGRNALVSNLGPVSRYTAAQMKHLLGTFMCNFISSNTTDDHGKVARWLYFGQPDDRRKGGHTIYTDHWDTGEAAVVWDLIRLTLELREDYLTKTQRKAYLRRQAWIEKHFGLNALEVMARNV